LAAFCGKYGRAMFRRPAIFLFFAAALTLSGCKSVPYVDDRPYSQFVGFTQFTSFTTSRTSNGEIVLLSPEVKPGADWNQLIVSWNTAAPAGSYVKVEAEAEGPDFTTPFYTMGLWSPDDKTFPRASASGQIDSMGRVDADTLVLKHAATAVQIKLTLDGVDGALPSMKFLGLSFCNTNVAPQAVESDHSAWGKTIPVVERSQQSYAGGNGWCSPTSLSMVLAYWGSRLGKPDWDLDAPEVAAGVFDHNFKKATGNWSFNAAFAGHLNGMRAYVTRFDDIPELEDWIKAGIPVIISARYDLLQDGRAEDLNGHLTVCCGFTETGDLIINDPWTDLKVESVQHVYKRENVRRAWATSHNTVYLVYPENLEVPPDRLGHWFE
jgi:hypothetical protein